MSRCLHYLVIFISVISCELHAQDYGKPSAIKELPEDAVAVDGEVNLWVDYKSSKNGKADAFIINKTAKGLVISKQDGDYYIKLEGLNEKADWQRAETHKYSWCGNSYGSIEIPINGFIRTTVTSPKRGKKGRVRYKIYGDLVLISNVGDGFFDEKQMANAELDVMALADGKIETLEKIIKSDGEWASGSLNAAIRRLTEYEVEIKRPLLGLALQRADCTDYQKDEIVNAISDYDPEQAAKIYIGLLDDGDLKRRCELLSGIPRKSLHVELLQQDIYRRVKNVGDPNLSKLIHLISRFSDQRSRDFLNEIKHSEKYSKDVHRYVHYLQEQEKSVKRDSDRRGIESTERISSVDHFIALWNAAERDWAKNTLLKKSVEQLRDDAQFRDFIESELDEMDSSSTTAVSILKVIVSFKNRAVPNNAELNEREAVLVNQINQTKIWFDADLIGKGADGKRIDKPNLYRVSVKSNQRIDFQYKEIHELISFWVIDTKSGFPVKLLKDFGSPVDASIALKSVSVGPHLPYEFVVDLRDYIAPRKANLSMITLRFKIPKVHDEVIFGSTSFFR